MACRNVICHFCHTNCRLIAQVEEGKLVKLAGNRRDMLTRGYICERAVNAPRWLYHPDQLLHPLKRVGKRGEGKWERVSWDRALDEVAQRLEALKRQHGPECLAFLEGTYKGNVRFARARFANHFGNPHNVGDGGNVSYLAVKSMGQILAGGTVSPASGLTRCLVFWGMNMDDSWSFVLDKIRPMIEDRSTTSEALSHLMEIPLRFLVKRPPVAHAIFNALGMMPRTGRDPKGAKFKLMPRKPKVIVIDPRQTSVAKQADVWLQVRPGTDAALALGWLHVIINENLFDAQFVERWCFGFDKLAEAVLPYTPEKVAGITGVAAEDIVAAARIYAAGRPSTIWYGMTPMQAGFNSAPLEQARVALIGITGNLDVFGGNELLDFPVPAGRPRPFVTDPELEDADVLPAEIRAKQLAADRCKLLSFPGWELRNAHHRRLSGRNISQAYGLRSHPPSIVEAMLTGKPYPIKAAISFASNALTSFPSTRRVEQALKSDNLAIHVVLDYFMTPTAQVADYVIPTASWLERPFCGEAMVGMHGIVAGERAVDPLGDRRHDYDFWRGLACRLGQEEHWPWKTIDELNDFRLHRLGMTHEELVRKGGLKPYWRQYRKYRRQGFATESGKLEVYSLALERLGASPLPYCREAPAPASHDADSSARFPLLLIAGTRSRQMFNSEQRQKGLSMREAHPDPLVQIHSATAAAHGISDGDWVTIETPAGSIRQRASLTDKILKYLVSCELGWWFPEKSAESLHGAFESNANVLTLDAPAWCDPLTGGWTNHGIPCRIEKCAPPPND